MATPNSAKSEKKHNKRVRDDETEDSSRKHKRSKSATTNVTESVSTPVAVGKKSKKSRNRDLEGDGDNTIAGEKEHKKKKKSKSLSSEMVINSDEEDNAAQNLVPVEEIEHSQEAPKSASKKNKKHRDRDREGGETGHNKHEHGSSKQKTHKSKDKRMITAQAEDSSVRGQASSKLREEPTSPKVPFITQTVSFFVPFFPVGFSKSPADLASEILDPLVGNYSPILKGILLAYRSASLSETPVRTNARDRTPKNGPVLLSTINECAAGFAWMTAEMDLFCPSRGAAMEGKLTLQSEGHIGLVCWNKFNASIEASRLPSGWNWVDTSNELAETRGESHMDVDDEQSGDDALDKEGLEQLHSVGYWVDESGIRVSGKLSFRIKNFQLFAGDHQYLSIEGTMLDESAERQLVDTEREAERVRRARQNPNSLLRPMSKRIPEFSMTTIGEDNQDEQEIGIPAAADKISTEPLSI